MVPLILALVASACGRDAQPASGVALFDPAMQLNPSKMDLRVGQSAAFSATVPNVPNASPIVWTVADTLVATILQNGVLLGRSAGSTTITAVYGDKAGAALVQVSP